MKLWFVLFTLLPFAGQLYIAWRVWMILPLSMPWKVLSMILLGICFVLFFTMFMMPLDKMPFRLAATMYQTGASWLFIMLYLFIIFLLLDLGRLVHLVPHEWVINSAKGSIGIVALMVALFTYAYFNYMHKERVEMTVETHKPLVRPLKIVMMADLHLGYINRKNEFHRWVDLVNAEQPDMVLIAGDIVDHGIRAITYQNMAEEFRRLQAPVYACLGNHEYYSDNKGSAEFYKQAGIHLLKDDSAEVAGIRIIGRDDRTNQRRKQLSQLSSPDPNHFTILMDHQPYHLEEAEQTGIDFQLSGHTHYGQMWPVSWIEDLIYEDAFGPHRRGDTQYYVTSGMGIWGAKFRIGTRSEYVVLHLKHQ